MPHIGGASVRPGTGARALLRQPVEPVPADLLAAVTSLRILDAKLAYGLDEQGQRLGSDHIGPIEVEVDKGEVVLLVGLRVLQDESRKQRRLADSARTMDEQWR